MLSRRTLLVNTRNAHSHLRLEEVMATQENGSTKPLSKRRQQILDVICQKVHDCGYPPSMREIAEAVGLASPSTVKHHVDALEADGFIDRIPGRSRALEVKRNEDASPAPIQAVVSAVTVELPVSFAEGEGTSVPLVGRIAAGAPITAEQYVEDVFELPTRLTGTGQLFMLEVHGESMIDAGILDGDFVVVHAQPTANDGDIVAAMIDDEATVKVLSHSNGHVWLLPRNEEYSPIPADQATILGRVVTVLRSL